MFLTKIQQLILGENDSWHITIKDGAVHFRNPDAPITIKMHYDDCLLDVAKFVGAMEDLSDYFKCRDTNEWLQPTGRLFALPGKVTAIEMAAENGASYWLDLKYRKMVGKFSLKGNEYNVLRYDENENIVAAIDVIPQTLIKR